MRRPAPRVTAALTAADMMTAGKSSLAGFGTGLRGGSWTSAGDHTVTLHLRDSGWPATSP